MGKLTAISVAALLVVAVAMVSAWGNETVHLIGLGIVVLIVFGAFWKITKTLDKHPELALLEGAEFIKYRQQVVYGNATYRPVLGAQAEGPTVTMM